MLSEKKEIWRAVLLSRAWNRYAICHEIFSRHELGQPTTVLFQKLIAILSIEQSLLNYSSFSAWHRREKFKGANAEATKNSISESLPGDDLQSLQAPPLPLELKPDQRRIQIKITDPSQMVNKKTNLLNFKPEEDDKTKAT